MGETQLLTTLAALTFGVALSAQGPVYRERWGYMQLERLRDTVWRELAGRDAATRNRVAELLVELDGGVPFAPPAHALAHLRGVEVDDAFLLRATLGAYLLPEIVDPNATNEVCRQLNVSLFLPFTVPEPGALAFEIIVWDGGGARVFEATVEQQTMVKDLRRARAVVQVPGAELVDGAYVVEVRALVDDAEPRSTDPLLRLSFHVLRGYQQRSEAAMVTARELSEDLADVPRGLLRGLAAEVSRAYQGEAFHGRSHAVLDLERLEAALENLAADRHVLDGLTGDVPVEIAAGERSIGCVLRLGEEHHPATAKAPRPLIVFAGGVPSYDVWSHRPSAPATRGARALASALRDFDIDGSWHVAFLESPGNGRRYANVLPAAITSLRQLLAVGEAPVVLVCEREAAAVAGMAIGKIRPHVDGIALVGAGAMTAPVLEGLRDLPVRAAMLHGYPSSAGLQRVLDYVAHKAETGEWNGDLASLTTESPAWLFGLRALVGPIAAFARQVAGG